MPALTGRRAALALAALLSAAPRVWAADCVESYEHAQEQRRAGRLRAARSELEVCVRVSCQAFIRTDCRRWLDEVEAAMPTVVFVARTGEDEVEHVTVILDGEDFQYGLDGRAVAIDPGKHQISFSAPGLRQADVEVLIVEGQKGRVIEGHLEPILTLAPVAAAPAPEPPVVPQTPAIEPEEQPWVLRNRVPLLAGMGTLGLGVFGVFASSGLREERQLANSCAPHCGAGEVQRVRDRYLIADVGLAVGVVSMAIAAYHVLTDNVNPQTARSGPLWSWVLDGRKDQATLGVRAAY
jgi:hypothetical protein